MQGSNQHHNFKHNNGPTGNQPRHKHIRNISSVPETSLSSSSVPLKEPWAGLLTDTDSWASCQWSITATSSDAHLPPPKNLHKHTLKSTSSLYYLSYTRWWKTIPHVGSDKLREAQTSLTGLTQSPSFSITVTTMWKWHLILGIRKCVSL